MEVSVENTGGLGRRMSVQVPAERVDEEVNSRLQSMTRTVRVAGFRPGKVPLRVIEKKYGKQVRHEVIDQVVNSTIQEAFMQNSIRPVGTPAIEPTDPAPGEPLRYVATFEVFPDLEGGIDCDFVVERPQVEITAADIDAMLETLRGQRAGWQAVDRPAQQGDQVTIDFEGRIDGVPFSGGKADNISLVLGSGKMIAGFEEQLQGVSAGDERTLQVTFPGDYHSAEVAGKTAEFAVRVKSVAESRLPELDDDFASSFGVGDRGVAGLREDVTANMQRELKSMLVARLKNQVFDGLLGKNPLEVPQALVMQEVAELMRQQGLQGEPGGETIESAEKRVKLGVLMSELARHNQIKVDPDRVRQNLEAIAASYENPDEVMKWYYSNQDMMTGVQTAVMEEQVVDWIIEHGGAEVRDRKMSFNELVEESRKAQT